MARSYTKTLGPLAMRSICAGDVEGPRYSRTSIMRAETGHGCGLQMLLKHNFNQVCSVMQTCGDGEQQAFGRQ